MYHYENGTCITFDVAIDTEESETAKIDAYSTIHKVTHNKSGDYTSIEMTADQILFEFYLRSGDTTTQSTIDGATDAIQFLNIDNFTFSAPTNQYFFLF